MVPIVVPDPSSKELETRDETKGSHSAEGKTRLWWRRWDAGQAWQAKQGKATPATFVEMNCSFFSPRST